MKALDLRWCVPGGQSPVRHEMALSVATRCSVKLRAHASQEIRQELKYESVLERDDQLSGSRFEERAVSANG